MADILQVMTESLEEDVVPYTLFMLDFSPDKNELHCFVEGAEDIKYYQSRLDSYAHPFIIKHYNCRGKDNVLKIYGLIKLNKRYTNGRTAFFIDRDFDQAINNPDIYETPFYSVENFYLQSSVITKFLVAEYNLIDAADLALCMQIYTTLFESFNQKTTDLNAWLSCYADKRNTGGNARLNIDAKTKRVLEKEKIKLVSADLLSIIDLQEIAGKKNIETLFDNNDYISDKDFNEKKSFFKNRDKSQVFRGKFAIIFLCDFLTRFQSRVANRNNPLCSKPYSSKLQYSKHTLLTTLSSYAANTKCLREYVLRLVA